MRRLCNRFSSPAGVAAIALAVAACGGADGWDPDADAGAAGEDGVVDGEADVRPDGADVPCLCNDGNVCTDDRCDPATGGCVFVANTAPCNDGSRCTTGDACRDGSCSGALVACSDGNICTDDLCDPASGCVFRPNAAPCNDGNSCTTGDRCSGGACTGTPLCNDGNACTDDTCDPGSGRCVFTANTAPCDDGNPCTTGDRCSGGACVAGTGLPAWYRDADRDGYGASAGTPVCSTTAPPDHVGNASDCCDSNANVRPNQTSYFASSYDCGSVVGSFDYNCDGAEELRWTDTGGICIWRMGDCDEVVGWQGRLAPRCGVAGTWIDECDGACRPVSLTRVQECR